MYILAFDTTNRFASVAISNKDMIIAYEEQLSPSMQAESLMNMIENCLNSSKLHYKDIDYLAITNGPGSFTGIRIGLAAALGISCASKIKSVVINNFELLNFRAKLQISKYHNSIVVMDAFRNQSYVQIFDYNDNPITEYQILNDEDVIKLISMQSGVSICSGSGVAKIYNKINQYSNIFIYPRFNTIKARYIIQYINYLHLNNKLFHVDEINPLYMRNASTS